MDKYIYIWYIIIYIYILFFYFFWKTKWLAITWYHRSFFSADVVFCFPHPLERLSEATRSNKSQHTKPLAKSMKAWPQTGHSCHSCHNCHSENWETSMGSNGSMIIVQLSLPKKKSPMITMGLALSDPMGCYGFKPRYPVVQSKIAVFFSGCSSSKIYQSMVFQALTSVDLFPIGSWAQLSHRPGLSLHIACTAFLCWACRCLDEAPSHPQGIPQLLGSELPWIRGGTPPKFWPFR